MATKADALSLAAMEEDLKRQLAGVQAALQLKAEAAAMTEVGIEEYKGFTIMLQQLHSSDIFCALAIGLLAGTRLTSARVKACF
jgi:hypothetical protein